MSARNRCAVCDARLDADGQSANAEVTCTVCGSVNGPYEPKKRPIPASDKESSTMRQTPEATGVQGSTTAESVTDVNPTTQLGILFSFKGRIPRSVLWLRGYLPIMALALVVSLVGDATYPAGNPFDEVMGILSLWPIVALSVKRCHDRDRSGWFCLLYPLPLVNWWVMVELWALPGTQGPNRFGPDPLHRGTLEEMAVRAGALAALRNPDASRVDEYVAWNQIRRHAGNRICKRKRE